jgi:hypothetical protein
MKFIVLSILSATALARENSAGFLNRLGVPDHENTFAVLKARADDVNDDLFVHAELFTGAKDSIPASFDSVENWPECSKVRMML